MSIESLISQIESAAANGDSARVSSLYRQISDENLIHDLTDADLQRLQDAVSTNAFNAPGRTLDANRDGLADGNASALPITSSGVAQNECPYRDALYEDELYLHVFNNEEILVHARRRKASAEILENQSDFLDMYQEAVDNYDRFNSDTPYRMGLLARGEELAQVHRLPPPRFGNDNLQQITERRDSIQAAVEERAAELNDIDSFNRLVSAKLVEVQFAFADEARKLCEMRDEIEALNGRVEAHVAYLEGLFQAASEQEKRALQDYAVERSWTSSTVSRTSMSQPARDYYQYLMNKDASAGMLMRSPYIPNEMIEGIVADRNLSNIMANYIKLLSGQDVTTSAEFWHEFFHTVKWMIIEEIVWGIAVIATGGVAYAVRAMRYIKRAKDFQDLGRTARARKIITSVPFLLGRGLSLKTGEELHDAFQFFSGKAAAFRHGNYGRRVNRTENAADAAPGCLRCAG